jgi:hypothetical protein
MRERARPVPASADTNLRTQPDQEALGRVDRNPRLLRCITAPTDCGVSNFIHTRVADAVPYKQGLGTVAEVSVLRSVALRPRW